MSLFPEKPKGTWIDFAKRKLLGLTWWEYIVCNSICRLSSNKKYQYCLQSKNGIAEHIGTTERNVSKICAKLLKRGLIEMSRGKYKATQRWKKLQAQTKQAVDNHQEAEKEKCSELKAEEVPV